MDSSKMRSWPSIATMVFLTATAAGCVGDRAAGDRAAGDRAASDRASSIGHTCQRVCVKSPVVQDTVSLHHATGERLVRREIVSPPAIDDGHASQSGLTINVIDLTDPVPKGNRLTYKIIVSNGGTLSEKNVLVVVTLPEGMTPIETGADGAIGRTTTGQIVRFDPVAEIGPGEQREYQVVVRALEAGQQTVRAELSSDKLSRPLDAEATTVVLP